MLNAKGRITPRLRIFSVPRRVSFVSQGNAYAWEAGEKTPEKPRTTADSALAANQLRLLHANDAPFRAVGEKLNRLGKVNGLVTIPETEKTSVTIEKLTIEDGVVPSIGNGSLPMDAKEEGFPCSQQ
jgi:hypothetical protein